MRHANPMHTAYISPTETSAACPAESGHGEDSEMFWTESQKPSAP